VSTEAEAPRPTCKVLLSWRHNRGEGDRSLQLSVTECQGSQYCVPTSFLRPGMFFFANSVWPSQMRCCCSIHDSVAWSPFTNSVCRLAMPLCLCPFQTPIGSTIPPRC
jgi:hypothetical protein